MRMIKPLLLFTLLIGRTFAGNSQTSGPDTLCLPVETIKKVYTAALQKKAADSMNAILLTRVDALTGVVWLLKAKDSATVAGYETQFGSFREEKALYQDQIKTYEKLLRRERLKGKMAAGLGIAATALTIWVSLKK